MMNRKNRRSSKRLASAVLAITVASSALSMGIASTVEAKTTRSAIVSKVSGKASVKKAGGSKTYVVYKDMTLNQGDLVITEAGSYVDLRIADRDDEIRIQEKSEVSISELTEQEGAKQSKVKAWAGGVWSKVKSLVGDDESFEVETPTAVMGVRGTHFYVVVDPVTGETRMAVAAGRVAAAPANPSSGAQTGNDDNASRPPGQVIVFPAQQINLSGINDGSDLRTNVDYIGVSELVQMAPPSVIEAILRSVQDIQRENEELRDRLQDQQQQLLNGSSLRAATPEDLNKVANNFSALLSNIAKEAVDQKKIDKEIIDEINRGLTDPSKKIDLNNVPPIDRSAGIDPEVERLKQQKQQQQQERSSQEQQKLLDNQKRLAEQLKKIEEERKRMEQANKDAAEKAKKEAEKKLMEQLNAEQRQQLQERVNRAEQDASRPVTPPATQPGGERNTEPAVTFVQAGATANGTVTLQLNMRNFINAHEVYTVQAHVNYDESFTYTGDQTLSEQRGNVFSGANALETMKEHPHNNARELIYVGTLLQTSSSGTLQSFPVSSTTRLVSIPLKVNTGASAQETVTLSSFRVFDKAGNEVYKIATPIIIQVRP